MDTLMLQKSAMETGAKEIKNHILVRPAPLQDPVRQHSARSEGSKSESYMRYV